VAAGIRQPQADRSRKEGVAVYVCVALDLSVSGFGPSGMGCNWLEVS